MTIQCPICSTKIDVEESQSGHKGRCMTCNSKFIIPASPDDPVKILEYGEDLSESEHEGYGRLVFAALFFGLHIGWWLLYVFDVIGITMAYVIADFGGVIAAALPSLFVITEGPPIAKIVMLLFLFIITPYRLMNIGRNPWWCLALLVPFFSILVFANCLIAPPGYEQHRKLDLAAKIMLGIMFSLGGLSIISLLISLLT